MCVSSIERLLNCSQYKVLRRVLKNMVELAGVVIKENFTGNGTYKEVDYIWYVKIERIVSSIGDQS